MSSKKSSFLQEKIPLSCNIEDFVTYTLLFIRTSTQNSDLVNILWLEKDSCCNELEGVLKAGIRELQDWN